MRVITGLLCSILLSLFDLMLAPFRGLLTLPALLNLVGAKRSQDTSRSLAPGAAATGGNDD